MSKGHGMVGRASSRGVSASTESVLAKPVTGLTIPVRTIDNPAEGMVLGFRQNMLEIGKRGSVDTGGGMGSDFIILEWDDRKALVRGSELLRAWVATFAPEDAARFPDEVKAPPA